MTELPVITDCEGCGVCCLHMGYPAFIQPVEHSSDEAYWRGMPRDLKDELLSYIADYQPPEPGQLDGPCFWFDSETRQCKHHQHRPSVCRNFKVGGIGCRHWRRHYHEMIRQPERTK